ncbi:hypothetical protein KFZ56_04465 [Virgibacillus sp. NKC19-3]|uniref:hypothetical protein n=1 Tax=Virgibacillus saliphilus TaxID=2831674 RepID=UPI001C9B961A|nr:hypothetical protein [Virgibacillus sp. NKC19-3]MBY7142359.1 hypothetical protein [Virgibacillus sp. NKC19-3]
MDEPSQEILNQLYTDLKNGEIDEAEFYSQLDNLKDIQSEEAAFKGLQQKDKEQLVEENGELVSALQTVFGNDWYSRFTDMASLAALTTNFFKRFDDQD